MKKLFFSSFVALFVAVSFNACAYTEGTEITQAQLDNIVIGKTKKSFLEENFGAPSKISNTSECEMWHYDFTKINSFGNNINESNVFCIDKKGVIIKKLKGKANNNPLLR